MNEYSFIYQIPNRSVNKNLYVLAPDRKFLSKYIYIQLKYGQPFENWPFSAIKQRPFMEMNGHSSCCFQLRYALIRLKLFGPEKLDLFGFGCWWDSFGLRTFICHVGSLLNGFLIERLIGY